MALTGGDITNLKKHQQWCDCRFVSFAAYDVVSILSFSDGTWTPDDMINIHPRHSWVLATDNITLDGTDSRQRDGSAVTGYVWTLVSGGGALVDNTDGTATYTAPAGTGTAIIKLNSDGAVDDFYARVAFGLTRLNIGAVTGFHADISTGGWEMTVRAYGDCSGLERQKGILLVVDDYWNGANSNFGGYKWAQGVFYGYVDRVRTVHIDSEQAYLEVKIVSPSTLLNRGGVCDLYFVRTDTPDDNIVLADFMAIDAVWWILYRHNLRHNVFISTDDNAILNLKVGQGPLFDVIQDIAARTFYISYDSKLGDLYVVGDIDIRYGDYFTGLDVEFTMDEDLFDAMDAQWEDITDLGDPASIADPTYGQVQLTAVGSDLEELFSRYPDSSWAGGLIAELGGLISETQADLDTWAQQYFYKLQPELTASIRMFLFHHVDLYSMVTWGVTIRNDLTNHGMGTPTATTYVTGIDYDIDPGLGTWRGAIQLVSRAVVVS